MRQFLLRPSAAPTWGKCAGSVGLAVPELEDSEDGDGGTTVREEGNAAHWVAQMIGTNQPTPAIGSKAPNGVEVDADMLDAAHEYVAFNRRTMGDYLLVEHPVHCWGIHEECGGTPDAQAFDPHTYTIHLSDKKYGYNLVEPDTLQLICYVDGVARMHNVDLSRATVHLTIYQPRAFHKNGPLRTIVVPGAQMLPIIAALRVAAHAALQPQATCVINPGCRNCSGRFQCETLRRAALQTVEATGRAIPTGLPLHAQEAELRILRHSQKMLEAYTSGLETVIEHQLRKGARGAVFHMREQTGRLRWKENATERVAFLAKQAGVEVYAPATLRTPTQLRSLLGDHVVDSYAHRPSAGVKLSEIDLSDIAKLFGK